MNTYRITVEERMARIGNYSVDANSEEEAWDIFNNDEHSGRNTDWLEDKEITSYEGTGIILLSEGE